MRRSQRILAVVNDRALYKKLAHLLDRSSFEVNRIPSGAGALILVGNLRYDLIVVEAPLPDLDVQSFLNAVRTLDSPCSASSVLILTQGAEELDISDSLLGDDMAVLPSDSEDRVMQSTASQLLGVAARSAARLLVQLHARVGEGSFKRVAQTANISETGMLLSGAPELPLKSKLELEFELPGDSRPIQATAEVVRHASPDVENLTGIGVRFLEMSAEAAERLKDFLEVRLGQRAGDQTADEDLDLDEVAPSAGG